MNRNELFRAASLSVFAIVFIWFRSFSIAQKIMLTPVTAVVPFLLFRAWRDYSEEQRQRTLEKEIPYALFHVAVFPASTSFEQRVASLSESGVGQIASEFERVGQRLHRGFSLSEAFEPFLHRNQSRLLHRTVRFIQTIYETGSDASDAFKRLGEHVLQLHQLAQEQFAMHSLQKYTVLLSAGLLIPFILGTLFSTSQTIDSSSASLYSTMQFVMPLYLALFSGVASLFLALQEGNIKKAVFYLSLVGPCSLLVFSVTSRFALL
ncbi:type II secretion system F family protein [Candidatus Micrarchaeota archaeon]|nr:type II secretion system F family protein [Candidatus Micrarchaeota archaeon]